MRRGRKRLKGGESCFTFDKDFGLRCSTLRRIHGGVSTENQKKLLAFLLLAICPVSKASGLDIVDVVVVIGVVVGISDGGNLKKASVRTIVGVVVIVNVAEGTEAGED